MNSDVTLIVPAWKRPLYLRRALDSWTAARGFCELRSVAVALAPSPVGEEMEKAAFGAWIWPDSERAQAAPGPHTAVAEAVNRAFGDPGCEFVIVSEDDQIVSDDILEYVAFCRSLDVDVVNCHSNHGQGYSPRWDDTGADQATVRVMGAFSSFTWGVPRDAWTQIWLPSWDWDCTSGDQPWNHGYDWQMHRISQGRRCAIPDATRTQNIGQYDGTHADPALFWATQCAAFRRHRDPVAYVAYDDAGA